MSAEQVMEIMKEAMLVAFEIAGPLLIISIAVGLLVAIFQAATQIHVPKNILCSPQNTPGLIRNHPDLTQNARTHGPASLKMTGTGLRLMIRWSLFPWLKRGQDASC